MTWFDLFRLLGSPQIMTLLIVLAGLAYMVGLRRAAGKLILAALVIFVCANLFAIAPVTHAPALLGLPIGFVRPLLAIPLVIVGCWVLRGLIALFFGRNVADAVVTDVLAWTIKAIIRVTIAPGWLIRQLLRTLSHEPP
jgi:hypothetical protein